MQGFINQAYDKLYDHLGYIPSEGETFEALYLVEVLWEQRLISWDVYHEFISEERSSGRVPCYIKDFHFNFPHIDCTKFHSNNLPKDDVEEMYFTIYRVVNDELRKMREHNQELNK